jgi:hypothetical protein
MTTVSLAEAARRLQVSERTVRRRLDGGKLHGTQVQGPRGFEWLVDLPEEETAVQAAPAAFVDDALRLERDELLVTVHRLTRLLAESEAERRQLLVPPKLLPAPPEHRYGRSPFLARFARFVSGTKKGPESSQ